MPDFPDPPFLPGESTPNPKLSFGNPDGPSRLSFTRDQLRAAAQQAAERFEQIELDRREHEAQLQQELEWVQLMERWFLL